MVCISGKVKHACCSVCLFIVVLALEQHSIPSVLAQESTNRAMMEFMSWGTGPKQLQLEEPQASMVVLLVNDEPWTVPSLKRLRGNFSVQAPRGHGLLAVIQILNLRSETTSGGSLVCKDYIKFTDVATGISSGNTCGELKKEQKSFIPPGLINSRVFHSPAGRIDVSYESDVGQPQDEDMGGPSEQRQVVEIVFTAYTECVLNTFRDHVSCGGKCISHVLSCDEHINCGFEEDFASDEANCPYSELGSSSSGGSGSGRPPYLVSLYLGAILFFIIIAAIAFYHRHTTYQRIKNMT